MDSHNPQIDQAARLEDYIRAIRSHPILVVSLPLLFFISTWIVADAREDVFEANASVALGPTPVGAVNTNLAQPIEERESAIVRSNAVAEVVARDLNLPTDGSEFLKDLSVKFVPGSTILNLTFVSQDREQAAAVLNGFASAYVDQRERQADEFYGAQIDVLSDQAGAIQQTIDELEVALLALETRRSQLNTLDVAVREPELADVTALITAQRADAAERSRTLTAIEDDIRSFELRVRTRQETASVLQAATEPGSPRGIASILLALGGLMVGAILAVAAAFIWERLDNRSKGSDEVALVIDAPVLGEVPLFARRNRVGPGAVVMTSTASNERVHFAREAYRRLRSVIQFASMERENPNGGFVVSFTSAHPGEGKSVTSVNLAVSLGQAGKRVVLVSADMRRPTVEALLGIADQSAGLSTLLSGGDPDLEILETSIKGLFVLPAGPTPLNASELLASERLPELLDQLRLTAEFVILDTPPVLSVADALVVGAKADATLLVIDPSRTDNADLAQARAELRRAGVVVLGGVLNRITRRRSLLSRKNRYAYVNSESSSPTS